jgi:hypothetical protein
MIKIEALEMKEEEDLVNIHKSLVSLQQQSSTHNLDAPV